MSVDVYTYIYFFNSYFRKQTKRARELWWSGLPPCVRGKVWKLAIGNELNITEGKHYSLRDTDKHSRLVIGFILLMQYQVLLCLPFDTVRNHRINIVFLCLIMTIFQLIIFNRNVFKIYLIETSINYTDNHYCLNVYF